jgi:hypothetical protein
MNHINPHSTHFVFKDVNIRDPLSATSLKLIKFKLNGQGSKIKVK